MKISKIRCLSGIMFILLIFTIRQQQPQLDCRVKTCSNCNPHDFNLIINAKPCSPDQDDLDVLFLVFSHPKNVNRRQIIRDTWFLHAKQLTGF